MEFILRVGIPIYESLVCFAYNGLGGKLLKHFPEVVVEEEWFEIGEYSRLESFLKSKETDAEISKTMLRQLRAKQIAHGPTLRFSMPSSDKGIPISGSFNRWGLTFKRQSQFAEDDQTRILEFLSSLGLGTVENYSVE